MNFEKYANKSTLFNFENMDGYYIIYERPYLQEFLTFLFNNFNVSIWTAASKDYALFIIEKILLKNYPDRKIDFIFFSYHCDVSSDIKNTTKNLNMIWDIYKLNGYDKDKTIIIDDYSEVFNTQPDKCIISPPILF